MSEADEYEWDQAKAEANAAMHGVRFEETAGLDWDAAQTIKHVRGGETRFRTFAPIGPRLYCLVWTQRGARVRVISFRKANNREIQRYEG